MIQNPADATARLSDLRRAQPASPTLENLLVTLSGQIRACSRLAVFEYEAGTESHPACAAAFRAVADAERAAFNTLLVCLRDHLDEMDLDSEAPAA